MKVLFLVFIILLLLNNINIKEPFENPDEKIFKSCGNNYEIDYNSYKEPENGLYTEVLKMKYKNFNEFKDDIPLCYEETHPKNDKNSYDYFNSNLLDDPFDVYSKPDETHKPILYGFDTSKYKIN
jgi:hypothetical protein